MCESSILPIDILPLENSLLFSLKPKGSQGFPLNLSYRQVFSQFCLKVDSGLLLWTGFPMLIYSVNYDEATQITHFLKAMHMIKDN